MSSLVSDNIFGNALVDDQILKSSDLVRGGIPHSAVLADLWLLTSDGVAVAQKQYVWDDTENWNDAYFFTEGI